MTSSASVCINCITLKVVDSCSEHTLGSLNALLQIHQSIWVKNRIWVEVLKKNRNYLSVSPSSLHGIAAREVLFYGLIFQSWHPNTFGADGILAAPFQVCFSPVFTTVFVCWPYDNTLQDKRYLQTPFLWRKLFVRNMSRNGETKGGVKWHTCKRRLAASGWCTGPGQEEYLCLGLEKERKPLEGFKEIKYNSGKDVGFFGFVYF